MSSSPPRFDAAAAAAASDAQAREIAAEVEASPLLSEREPPSILLPSYAENAAFAGKLSDLCRRWAGIRRCRGDGSCFYRSFLVSAGERFIDAGVAPPGSARAAASAASPLQGVYSALLATVAGADAALIALGYSASTVPDFTGALAEWLAALAAPGASKAAQVHAPFREQMTGFYLIYALRLLVSLEMQSHEEDYRDFVLGATEHASVRAFCAAEVELSSVDADQMQIVALVRACRCSLDIAYLDAAPGDAVQVISFPQEGGARPPLLATLLYRPGHYDIVYEV